MQPSCSNGSASKHPSLNCWAHCPGTSNPGAGSCAYDRSQAGSLRIPPTGVGNLTKSIYCDGTYAGIGANVVCSYDWHDANGTQYCGIYSPGPSGQTRFDCTPGEAQSGGFSSQAACAVAKCLNATSLDSNRCG